MPRIFGYVFNPLNVYFCYDNDGRLSDILYEVSNTFGEKHDYVFHIDSPETRNHFHVCKRHSTYLLFWTWVSYINLELDSQISLTLY